MAPALYLDSLSGVVHWEGALEAEHLLRGLWSSLILSPGHLTVIIMGIAIGQSLLLPIIIKKKDKADKTKIRFKTLPLAHLTWLLRGHCQGFSSGNKELTKHTLLSRYFCVGLGLGLEEMSVKVILTTEIWSEALLSSCSVTDAVHSHFN